MRVDLQPRVRVFATHLVHRLGVRLDDPRQLALPPRHQPPSPAHPVPPISKPPFGRAAAPRPDGILGLVAVDALEGLVEAAQVFDWRRQLLVVRRILFEVLHQAR